MSRAHAGPGSLVPDAAWAQTLERRGLAAPALFLLELARPWQVIAGQLLLMVEPFYPAAGRGTLRQRADLLADGALLDALIQMLEYGPAGIAPTESS